VAFNGIGLFTLKAGESANFLIRYPSGVGGGVGDAGAQTIRAHPERGFNLRLITSNQGKALEASFPVEWQSFVYSVTVRCEKVTTTFGGNRPNPPPDEVATFSLQGGGNI
jgi:hypothetical protein